MATSTIGSGGDYATLSDWITFLQSDHGSGDGVLVEPEIGQILDHQTASSSYIFTDITTSISNYIELTSSESNRHNGISNESGGNDHARITVTGGGIILIDINHFRFNWLELIGSSNIKSSGSIRINSLTGAGAIYFHNNIFHNNNASMHGDNVCLKANIGGVDFRIHRNFIYGYVKGIQAAGNAAAKVYNNTVFACSTAGIQVSGQNAISRNNLCFGNVVDFDLTDGSNDYNASQDGSATGDNSHTGINPSNYIVAPTDTFTSTDLHRKEYSGSEVDILTDTGQDVGSDFETDIDGEGILVDWDIGADEGFTNSDVVSIPVTSPLELEIDAKRWSSDQLPSPIVFSGHVESATDVDMSSVYITFTGSGFYINDDFTAITNTSGNYSIELPFGWTGTVSAALLVDHPHMTNTSAYVFEDPLIDDLSGTDFIFTYTPPIGISTPAFGIYQQSPPPPDSWSSVVAPYYYVDNTHDSATDSGETDELGNYYGHPGVPRETIPAILPAGAVVFVAGGPYEPTRTDNIFSITATGTSTSPVFISSYFPNTPAVLTLTEESGGALVRFEDTTEYCVFENFDMENCTVNIQDKFLQGDTFVSPHHLVIRHCEIHDTDIDDNSTGIGLGNRGTNSELRCHDLVFYNNYIHDIGDRQGLTEFDQDAHGISPGVAYRIWMLDNEMTRVSGDGMQVGNSGGNNPPSGDLDDVTWYCEDIYFGYNHSYNNKQAGAWVKVARRVIFSQNTIHDCRPTFTDDHCPSSPGAGLGLQFHNDKIFYIYNEIYNCDIGIIIGDTSARGTVGGRDVYFIGNVIHDINHTVGNTGDGGQISCGGGIWSFWTAENSAGRGIAILIRRGWTVNVLNNTIVDCEGGIFVGSLEALPEQRIIKIHNNIVYNCETMRTMSFTVSEDTSENIDLSYNTVYHPAGDPRIRWYIDGSDYTFEEFVDTFPDKSTGIIIDNPDFSNLDTENFRITSPSPCVDSGLDMTELYNNHQAIFNNDASIFKDFDGQTRPVNSTWDMGAFEFDGSETTVELGLLQTIAITHDDISIDTGTDVTITIPKQFTLWKLTPPTVANVNSIELDIVEAEYETLSLGDHFLYNGPNTPDPGNITISSRRNRPTKVPYNPYAVKLKYTGTYSDRGGFDHVETKWNIRSEFVEPYINFTVNTRASGPSRNYTNVHDGTLRSIIVDVPQNQTKIKVRIQFKSSNGKWSSWSNFESFKTPSKDYKRPGGNPARND